MRPTGTWLFGQAFFTSGANGSKEWSSDLWMAGTGTPSPSYNYALAASAFHAFFSSSTLLACLGSDVFTVGSKVIVSQTTTISGGSFYNSNNGGGASIGLPEEVCAVVRLQAAGSGRRFRGRLRIAGIDEASVAGNYLVSSGMSNFASWTTSLLSGFTDQGILWKPSLYSRTDNVLRTPVSLSTNALLGTQRHRRPRF